MRRALIFLPKYLTVHRLPRSTREELVVISYQWPSILSSLCRGMTWVLIGIT